MSNSKNRNKVVSEFCVPTHILRQVTLETVPLKLVGSHLLTMSKAPDPGGQGRFPLGRFAFHLEICNETCPFMHNSSFCALFRALPSQLNICHSKFESLCHGKSISTRKVCLETPSIDTVGSGDFGEALGLSPRLLFCTTVTYRSSGPFGTWTKQESC